jgi:folate-binding protein YgfZ
VADRYAARLDRDVIAASGPEATDFLQGQLSQDLSPLGDGDSAWSWVLAPTGKVDALVRVTRLSDQEWLLDTDAGWGELLVTRLNRFKLRTKVTIEPRRWEVLALRGPDARPEGDVVVPAWPGVAGVDVLGESPSGPEGWELVAADEYDARRIAAGIPRMGSELNEKTIPAETGLVGLTVSFTKGCYTGQELVARIDSRGGHAPRHLERLRMNHGVAPGTELSHQGERAGVVTSSALSPGEGWVGLGYIKRGVDPPVTLEATTAGSQVEVTVLASPAP